MSMHWGKVEKIARVLERDYVIQGYKINSIVGINYIDVAAHDFDIDATEINLEVISPKNVLTSERNYNLNGITREQG